MGQYYIDPVDRFLFGALVRCPINQPACPISVALWSLSQGAASSASYTLPADGRWYFVELQGEQYTPAVGNLRFEVYNNHPSVNVDIDMGQVHWSQP
jgi:hypothetical protein